MEAPIELHPNKREMLTNNNPCRDRMLPIVELTETQIPTEEPPEFRNVAKTAPGSLSRHFCAPPDLREANLADF